MVSYLKGGVSLLSSAALQKHLSPMLPTLCGRLQHRGLPSGPQIVSLAAPRAERTADRQQRAFEKVQECARMCVQKVQERARKGNTVQERARKCKKGQESARMCVQKSARMCVQSVRTRRCLFEVQ